MMCFRWWWSPFAAPWALLWRGRRQRDLLGRADPAHSGFPCFSGVALAPWFGVMLAQLLVTLSWIGAGAAVTVGLISFAVNAYRSQLEA